MPFASLLIMAMLLPAAGTSQPAAPAPTASHSQAQPSSVAPADPASSSDTLDSDDVCYKIRAYIFKRDDDHAPEYVRSTTCGPRKPHTRNANWPKAKLVPAN